IAAIYVSVGQQVTAGQPLAKLDTTDLDAALAQAQANLVTAQNNYNRTASTTSDAQKALNQARQQAAQDLATAQAALNKLTTNYTAAKNNSNSVMGAAYADLQTYQAAIFTTAMNGYNLTVSRLNGAIDTTNAPLSQVASAVTSAQAFLNSSTSRYNSFYDELRGDLATLLTAVTTEQQLASNTKTKLTQATSYLATVNDAVGGSIATATQNVTTTAQRGQQSIDSAQTSLNSKPCDLTNSQASVDNAASAVQTAQANLDNAVVTAPSSGVVASIASQVGETAANPFMVLANTTSLVLHGTIGESDVAKVKLGLVANVAVDAVSTAGRMTGRVTSLDPVATIQSGVPVYGIDVTIDLPNSQVKPGMTGTATVIIASRQNVLTVPNLAN